MGIKEVAVNKKARFDYFIEETVEAGISLSGAEVKSAKMGHINVADSFCFIENGGITLKNCRIAPYEKGSAFNLDPLRDRVLLLHKREIAKFIGKVREKGYTLVPLSLYFSGGYVKAELGLCRGKKLYDKRESDAKRQADRDIDRHLKDRKYEGS